MKAKHLLLASIALCAISAPHYAKSVIPVNDASANTSLASQLAQQVQMVASMAQQVTSLTNLVSLATVASTALGDTVDPAMSGLFNSLQDAYGRSMQAYGSIMSAPERINQQLALFQPPSQGWGSMTFPQLVQRAKQIQQLTLGTNSAAVSAQADALQRRVDIARQAAIANGMADRSISALSAAQAVAQQMRVTGQILGNIEESNQQMATIIAEKASGEEAMRQAAFEMQMKDSLARHQQADAVAGQMQSNPLLWGSH